MVYFRDYEWLVINGTTRFDAYIKPGAEEAHWSLDMRCVATGLPWRRVREWERPSLWLVLSGFKPKLRTWTDLERMNFWNLQQVDDDAFCGPGGWLDVDFYPKNGSKARENSFVNDVIWRVAGREAGWFTVELAGFTDGRSLWQQLTAQEVAVTPDGKEAHYEPNPEFWKEHAELYLVEHVPFGTVTVRVPRNSRDPEAHALARARALVGVGEPEHIEVSDYYEREKECSESLRDDIFVFLHYNGFYED